MFPGLELGLEPGPGIGLGLELELELKVRAGLRVGLVLRLGRGQEKR